VSAQLCVGPRSVTNNLDCDPNIRRRRPQIEWSKLHRPDAA
jgi:hypothetical protein